MTYFLETSSLGFRNWLDDDFNLAKALLSDPLVTQDIYASPLETDQEIKDFLKKEMSNVKKFGVQIWPFFDLNKKQFIGVCGLRPYKLFDGIFELSIQILPEFWHQGYGYKACSAMIDYAVNTLNIKSLFVSHPPQNTPAASLLKKMGFKFMHVEYYPATGINHNYYLLNANDIKERFGDIEKQSFA